VSGVLVTLLLGCGGPKPDAELTDSGTSEDTAANPNPDPAPWPHLAYPGVKSDEFSRGRMVNTWVGGAPVGARVLFYTSGTSMGEGPCEDDGHCFDILDPVLLGEAVSGEDEIATLVTDVAADEPFAHRYVQAVVEDPDSAARAFTNVLLRYVVATGADSPVSFSRMTSSHHPSPNTVGNTHTGGVAWIDYNNDYWSDLFVTNGADRQHFLFRNDGDGTFTDVSHLVPKPSQSIEDAGVKFGDLDNDGDSDIIVTADNPFFTSYVKNPSDGGPNMLYRNEGDGTFVEVAASAGIVDPRGWRTSSAALADIDNDGFLDLYLANWAVGVWPHENTDRMLLNRGDGTFDDVTEERGADGGGRDPLTVMFFDADLDGFSDLYVGNTAHVDEPPKFEPDDLFYRNDGGFFREVIAESPGMGDDAIAAMGMDVGDIDNDGDFDLYVTDFWNETPTLPKGNPLYLGHGDGTFSDNACEDRGVCVGYVSWPANFEDLDRDGDVDLVTGTQNDFMPDQVFINDGTGHFTYRLLGPLTNNAAHGGSTADYDGDGAVDLFFWNQASSSVLFRNDGIDDGEWLQLRLFGTVSNRDAIGAVVRATAGGVTQMRRVSGGDSAHSQRELIVHFGLGTHATAEVEITWPSGAVQTLGSIDADQLVFVDETAGVLTEDLTETTATWSASAEELTVTARSSFGGRTALSVDGDALTYDAAAVQHVHSVALVTVDPGSVEIVSERGGSWTVSTQVVP